jgi:trans-aconitate 2-methyltransferase
LKGHRWDPAQYDRYAEQRSRPFDDLVARIPLGEPKRVVDLGCGHGALTRRLAERWPAARISGVDNSFDMIAAATQREIPGRLDFVEADLREWQPDGPVDLVVSNAALQWVPEHLALLARFAGWLAPGGVLAFQVPDNFDEPSHVVVRELRSSPQWQDRLGADADRSLAVERPERYLDVLTGLALSPDVWQTTYFHLLSGDDAVLEWMKGTALRPVLDALAGDQAATAAFLDACGAGLRAAYPPGPAGTLLPFRRTFAVGISG